MADVAGGQPSFVAFHSAVRTWALEAIANGALTVAEIKSGATGTRALAPAAGLHAPPVREVTAQSPSRLAPCGESSDARQTTFEQLLARTIAARRR
jgi:hypothetical protein